MSEPWYPVPSDEPVWRFGPAYRDPPEPVICCALCEDDPEHDSEACLAESAEADAERRAEEARERERDW